MCFGLQHYRFTAIISRRAMRWLNTRQHYVLSVSRLNMIIWSFVYNLILVFNITQNIAP